jgi:hypothetical protein
LKSGATLASSFLVGQLGGLVLQVGRGVDHLAHLAEGPAFDDGQRFLGEFAAHQLVQQARAATCPA